MLVTPLKSPCSAWSMTHKIENYFHVDAKERGLKCLHQPKTQSEPILREVLGV